MLQNKTTQAINFQEHTIGNSTQLAMMSDEIQIEDNLTDSPRTSQILEKSPRMATFKTSVDLFIVRKPKTQSPSVHNSVNHSVQDLKNTSVVSPKPNLPTQKLSISNFHNSNVSIQEKVSFLQPKPSRTSSMNLDIPDYIGPRTMDFNAKGMGNGFVSSSLRIPKLSNYPNTGPGPGSYQLKGIAEAAAAQVSNRTKVKNFSKSKKYPVLVINQDKRPPVGAYDYSLDVVKKNSVSSCANSFRSQSQRDYGLIRSQGPPPGTYDILEGEARQFNRLYKHRSSFFAEPVQKKKNIFDLGTQLGVGDQISRKMQQVHLTHLDAARIHRSLEPRLSNTQEQKKNTISQTPQKQHYQSLRSLKPMVTYSTLETRVDTKDDYESSVGVPQKKFYL